MAAPGPRTFMINLKVRTFSAPEDRLKGIIPCPSDRKLRWKRELLRMGKRIVLIEMSTEVAEAFIRSVDRYSSVMLRDPNDEAESFAEAEVVAVVARPTVWCRCAVPEPTGGRQRRSRAKRESGWTRGGTFGWWLCVHCKRPSRACVMHFVTNLLGGMNDLLPVVLGTGTPLSPHQRWLAEGGIPADNANYPPPMPFAKRAPRSRKTRRSDTDRDGISPR